MILDRFLRLFDHRYSSLVCTAFAIINRVWYSLFTSNIGRDERVQITMVENMLSGKCFCQVKYFTDNLQHPFYDEAFRFPPGFASFFIPFLIITGKNVFLAYTILDVLSGLFFIFIFRTLCKQIKFPLAFVNILIVIAGSFHFIFFRDSSTADILGLNFILTGLVVAGKIVNEDKSYGFFQIAIYGLIFFLPAFFRFMYLPFVFLFPFLIFYYGFITKNKRTKKIAGWLTAATFLYFIILLWWLFSVSAAFVRPTERGFFPDQILKWFPFFISSFINLDFIAIKLQQLFSLSYKAAVFFLMFCNTLLFVLLYFGRKLLQRNTFSFFSVAGWALSLLIILQVAYLSSTYKNQVLPGIGKWNYTDEGRYFAFLNVFILVFVFYHLIMNKAKKSLVEKFFFAVIFILLSAEIVRELFYNARMLFNYDKMRNELLYYNKPHKQFYYLLDSLKKNATTEHVFISSADSYYLNYAAANGGKSIYDAVNLNSKLLSPPTKSLLLLVVEDGVREQYIPFLESYKPKLLSRVDFTNFYLLEIASED